jgi:hypothetical protein
LLENNIMARRKNVKRIDPRYFLDETVNRNDDGSALEECGEMDGEAIDISAHGTEVHVDDISQLSPEEAFAAGMAAARDAIDQAMDGADGPPPDGGFSGNGPFGEPVMQEIEQTRLDESKQHRKGLVRLQELAKIRNEGVVKGPWPTPKPSKSKPRWISRQRAAEDAAAKEAAKKAAKEQGSKRALRSVTADTAEDAMFRATKQAGKKQAARTAALRTGSKFMGPYAAAAGFGDLVYHGTRGIMNAALPDDSGLRKSSGELMGLSDLGLAFDAPRKGRDQTPRDLKGREGLPRAPGLGADLKTNPNKAYNPYLDPENTGTDSAGRLRPELKEAEFQDTGYPEEDIEVNRAADRAAALSGFEEMQAQQKILNDVVAAAVEAAGDWVADEDSDWPAPGVDDRKTFLQKLDQYSQTYAGVRVADVLGN